MKVFIVEDSPAVLERLMELVGEVPGTEIVGNADTYDTAVSGILAARPEIAILDIKLANDRGSGIDVLNKVKSALPELKAIMLSNYATPQHVKASSDAGAEYFLDKSVEFDRISAILRAFQDENGALQGE